MPNRKWLAGATSTAAVALAVVAAIAVPGVASAGVPPCGKSSRVGAAGAQTYQDSPSGWRPTARQIPGGTNINAGQRMGNYIEAIGRGFIKISALEDYREGTCHS
jgi:hypothetical protein